MKFDPETYSISIRKEDVDGEIYYVGRVTELPNISCYEDTYSEAWEKVIDAVTTLKRVADEDDVEFPIPFARTHEEYSGRVTLRIPKSLHASLDRIANEEGTSLNQLILTAAAVYAGEYNGATKASEIAAKAISSAMHSAVVFLKNAAWVSARTERADGKPMKLSSLRMADFSQSTPLLSFGV